MSIQLSALVPEFQKMSRDLSQIAVRAVCHGRKIQFAMSQFSDFVNKFAQNAGSTPLTEEQQKAYSDIVQAVRAFKGIFGSFLDQTWAHNALENSSSQAPTDICGITSRLREVSECLDPEAAKSFDSTSPKWLSLHILDIKAISASFNQYLVQQFGKNPNIEELSHNSNLEPPASVMVERIMSINTFLKQYKEENVAPGIQVFSPIPIHYQSWRLQHKDLEEQTEVGKGVSAVVYKGVYKPTGEQVAIKRLKYKKLNDMTLKSFQREVSILATAIHPTILRFIGATDSPPFCIVTEWMPNNSLYHDIHKYHRLNATLRTIGAFDIARGMQFLHSQQIIHRDLKSLNVLIDKDLHTHICDFGFSKRLAGKKEELMTKNVGTPHWMAPELLTQSDTYDNKVDVYAYAIVLWELITCKVPYNNMEPAQIIAQVIMKNARPTIPANTPPALVELISKCWETDPTNRPTFTEIVHTFRGGEIIIPGADQEQVMEYINSIPLTPEEVHTYKLKDQLDSLPSEFSDSNIDVVQSLIENLERENSLNDAKTAERVWNFLSSFASGKSFEGNKEQFNLYTRGLVCFIDSPLKVKALNTLRNLPRDKDTGEFPLLDAPLVDKLINLFPTGDTSIDTDIAIIACHNNIAPQIALRAIDAFHVKLALEVCSHDKKTVPENLKKPLVDLCIKYLTNEDTYTVLSAMRCIVALDEAKSIPPNPIMIHMQSSTDALKEASYIVSAKMADEGVELPSDMIEILVLNWKDPYAATAITAACKSTNAARKILSFLHSKSAPADKVVLQILNVASKHEELRKDVKEKLANFKSSQPNLVKIAHQMTENLELILKC